MGSKIGAVIFFIILIVLVIGLVSFASEFFLDKPLITVLRDLLFLFNRER